MESVYFLIDTLGKQIISLNDLVPRIQRLQKIINEMFTSLHYAKSSAKIQAKQMLSGGENMKINASLFDVQNMLNFDMSLTEPENLLNFVYELETVWPLIKSKIELCMNSIHSSIQQANVSQRLSNVLNDKLQDSIQKNEIDKISLIAFNSDMAQLDARVSILNFILNSLHDDLNDLFSMFNYVVPLITNETLKPIFTLLLNSSKSAFEIIEEMNKISKNANGAPLINPRFLEMTRNTSTFLNKIDSSAMSLNNL